MRRFLLACLLLACPGWGQTIQSSDLLSFPAHQLTGAPAEVAASQAPIYVIQWEGSFPGFQLTFQASPLTSDGGGTLPARLLSFHSQGATFLTLSGDPIDAVSVETLTTATLDAPMVVLSVPTGIQGQWRYLPRPSNFRLAVPAEALAGAYQGQLTATITGTP